MCLIPKIRQANRNLDQWIIIMERRYECKTVPKLWRIISGATTHKLNTFLKSKRRLSKRGRRIVTIYVGWKHGIYSGDKRQ